MEEQNAVGSRDGTLLGAWLSVGMVVAGLAVHVGSWLTVGSGPITEDTLRFLYSGNPAAVTVILLTVGAWLASLHIRHSVHWRIGAAGVGLVALWVGLVASVAPQVVALVGLCVVAVVGACRRAG